MIAQALPTASRLLGAQIGGGVSFSNPDYASGINKGISIYGDIDVGKHFGVEGDFHDLSLVTPHDIGENTFLLGVRYGIERGRFHPYAKALAGVGTFEFQQGYYSSSSSSHKAFAFGGGVDYRFKPRINIRLADLEYQHWSYGNGLTPWVLTIGAAYHF
jgi:hypothetical protein